ncbi:MAG: NADH-quinone oxidoreductase subunit C [Myxococcota bacterium]
MTAHLVMKTEDIPAFSVVDLAEQLKARRAQGARVLSLFGRKGEGEVVVTVVLLSPGVGLQLLRTTLDASAKHRSLTASFPEMHIFERELTEALGVRFTDHPWLKPVRFPSWAGRRMEEHPFFKLEGKEVHEVGVGPVHAGVIEPGHFRFSCLGELVHHLEIQLGYQHRGAESLLLQRPPTSLAPLVESLAGDTSVAHVAAYCRAVEALAGIPPDDDAALVTAVANELERMAMHLAGLSGIATDVGFLPGSSTYGRLRTAVINLSMRLCGSRFSRGWFRPGGPRRGISAEALADIRSTLTAVAHDFHTIHEHMFSAASVRERLVGTGILTTAQATEMGVVGMVGRASGRAVDLRTELPGAPFTRHPLPTTVEPAGDCWSRAMIRARELPASLEWILRALKDRTEVPVRKVAMGALASSTLAVAVTEGWRGEVVHALETGPEGKLVHYRVQDPSLRNWFGLALAVRNNDIYDFPICNKSFDLSYCGHDL